MAVTNEQKIDFLLKKIGFTKTKTGSVVGTGAISGTPKQPFAEAIPSPLIIANGALWNESDQIPTTPPTSDTTQVKVYLAATSGLRMTADSTSSGQRAYIAYSTYNNTSSARLTNWIDTQFGASYLIKVYKGDPNSGGVALSAAGSGANDGWFFDYSAGVLNFNDTSVPSGVTDTNIYIVGYRYIGSTGAPTPGTSTFNFTDLTISRNLKVGGISTFTGLVDANGGAHIDNLRLGIDADNEISTSSGNLVLDSASGATIIDDHLDVTGNLNVAGVLTYEDVKNVDSVGLGTFREGIFIPDDKKLELGNAAGSGDIRLYSNSSNNNTYLESYSGSFTLENKTNNTLYINSNFLDIKAQNYGDRYIYASVNSSVDLYYNNVLKLSTASSGINVVGTTTTGQLAVTGVSTFTGNIDANGDLDVDGHTNLDNVSVAGVTTFAGIIEGVAGENKIPSLYGALTNLPSAGSYHGMFAHVHATGRGYFAHAGNWLELVNKETNGNVGTGTETYNIGNITATGIDLNGDIDVDGHTELDNVRIAGVTTTAGLLDIDAGGQANTFKVEDLTSGRVVLAGSGGELEDSNNLRFDGNNLFVSGINVLTSSGSASTSIIGEDIVTRNFKATGISTIAGPIQFDSTIKVGGSNGINGQYLKSTGSGVAWDSFPSLRTRQTFTASSGQKTFSFAYTVGFLDVYVNGIKLTDSEFTATNGLTTVLSVGCFVGDIVELVAYNTVSAGGAAFGIGNVVEDLSPQLGGNLDLFNKTVEGTGNVNMVGVVTATKFVGDGSLLTGVTASGTGVVIKHDGNTVGTAGTINFSTNLDVSAVSAGIVTITATGGGGGGSVSGINTISGVVNIANDLDVDGHTNLDNVSVSGISTFSGIIDAVNTPASIRVAQDIQHKGDADTKISFPSADTISFETAGTEKLSINSSTVSIPVDLDITGDLDVDGHTNFDNVSIAGVTTFSSAITVSDIRNNSINLRNATGGATYATFSNGGAATLNFDNTPRLATSNAGITVTGTVAATSYTGDGSQLTGITGISTADVRTNTLNVIGVSTLTNIDVDDFIDVGNNIQLGNAGVITATTFNGGTFFGTGADINGDIDVDGHTNLDNVSISGFVTATKYFGDGSGLTGITASGTGVVVKDDGSTVGTAGTFNFTSPIDITPVSSGITTVGIDTNQFNVNNLDVLGISTFSDNINLAQKIVHLGDTDTSINFPALDTISFNTGGGTRLQIGPQGQLGIAGANYGNGGQVLTSQGGGSIITWADPPNNIGVSTNIANGYTQNAGATNTLDTYAYGTDDLVFEYTIFLKVGSDYQSQKLLAMRDGTTIHSTQFAIMFSSTLLFQAEAINSGSNILLRITPETGVSGSANYRVKREVM